MSEHVTPSPAATVALLREGVAGVEVLLLRRRQDARFAPGAFVFPGGLVDAGDASASTLAHLDGVSPETAASRLGIAGVDPPAIAYYAAALREAFEETGILLGAPDAITPEEVSRARSDLLERRASFGDILERLRCRAAGGGLVYFAHWITPERFPRRYDTRFFATAIASGAEAVVDAREMTEAAWISPGSALREHGRGSLPMFLPTVRTLERLRDFPDLPAMLDGLAAAPVETIIPK